MCSCVSEAKCQQPTCNYGAFDESSAFCPCASLDVECQLRQRRHTVDDADADDDADDDVGSGDDEFFEYYDYDYYDYSEFDQLPLH